MKTNAPPIVLASWALLLAAACGEHNLGELTTGGSGGGSSAEGMPTVGGSPGTDTALDESGGADGGAGGCDEDTPSLSLSWSTPIGTQPSELHIRSTSVTPSGEIVIAGHFSAPSMSLGPGVSLTAFVDDPYDAGFVAKLDMTGQPLWGRVIDGPHNDQAKSVAVTSTGDVVVAGIFCDTNLPCTSTFQADGGAATRVLSGNYHDGFVAVYDAAGDLSWAEPITSPSSTDPSAVAVGPNDEIVVVGGFHDEVGFGPSGEQQPLHSDPVLNGSMYVARYDARGFTWARGVDAHATMSATIDADGVAIAPDGSIYIGGNFGPLSFGSTTLEVTFGPGEPGATTFQTDSRDGFVLKLGPGGQTSWVRRFGGERNDDGRAVAAGIHGDVFITGAFVETATWAAGEPEQISLTSHGDTDAYVARYRSDGTFDWVVQLGSERSCGSSERGWDISATADDGVVTAGTFNGPMLLGDPTQCSTQLPGEGWGNSYIAQFRSNGWLVGTRVLAIGRPVCVGGATLSDTTVWNDSLIAVGPLRAALDLGGVVLDDAHDAYLAVYDLE